MITLSYFPGCSLTSSSSFYDRSLRKVLSFYGVELRELEDWSCCGAAAAPAMNHELTDVLNARNIAIAERSGLHLLAPCSACYARTRASALRIAGDRPTRERVNEALAPMSAKGSVEVRNIIEALLQYVGVERVAASVAYGIGSVRAVPYYGCLLTRIMDVPSSDDIEDPSGMDVLLDALGTSVLPWQFKTECCGAGSTATASDRTAQLSGRIMAMAVKAGVTVRKVDMKALQRHLIEMKILPPDVLTMKDSFPLPQSRYTEAVKSLPEKYQGLGVVMTDAARSVPLLKAAFKQARKPEDRFVYAHVLAMMGHADGERELIEKVNALEWDKGWNFRGMGQFNRSVSWVDSYIIALGRARSKQAVAAIIRKANALDASHEFSHFRAVAMALEAIGDRSAAPVLGALLAKEGVGGYSFTMQADLPVIKNYSNREGDIERSNCLRELSVARALYRLGDHQGLGEKTLRAYAHDPRGAYATHATLVLEEGRK